ncbi:MAG: glycosyltransferase [Euryarchaeota archaeon]|nr:glycosyltransferase [Euryarchaeota archaeon]
MLFETVLILTGTLILRDSYYFFLYLLSAKKSHLKKEYGGEYTIIMPNYNKDPSSCLESVCPDNIIVVDDGSKNKEALEKWEDRVEIHYLEHRGKSGALNYGIEHSSGDIVILDSDTTVGEGALKKLVSNLREFDAVAGKIQVRKENAFISRVQAIEHLRIAMFRRVKAFRNKIEFIPGPFAAFRREVFNTEKFQKSKVEDLVFSEAIKDTFKMTYEPDAVAYTTMPIGVKELYDQRKHWAVGNMEELKMKRVLSYYSLAIADILILLLSLITWNFLPLFIFIGFESITMITANRIEKGNCLFESILFPSFMYFLAFFYLFIYTAAFFSRRL